MGIAVLHVFKKTTLVALIMDQQMRCLLEVHLDERMHVVL